MPISPSRADRAAIITRLRQSGCVFAEDEATLLITEADDLPKLDAMVAQRVVGLPLEHILGWAEFDGLRIAVGTGVFVPRHRTEFLIEHAARLTHAGAIVLDLCCGSGALGQALAARLTNLKLYASDIDPVAITCAHLNLAGHGAQIFTGDLYESLPPSLQGRVNTLLANVPYVPTAGIKLMPPEARLHEPRVALDGGEDGLDILRRVVTDAPRWLAPGGHLFTECSEQQAPIAASIVSAAKFTSTIITSFDQSTTIVIGTKLFV